MPAGGDDVSDGACADQSERLRLDERVVSVGGVDELAGHRVVDGLRHASRRSVQAAQHGVPGLPAASKKEHFVGQNGSDPPAALPVTLRHRHAPEGTSAR